MENMLDCSAFASLADKDAMWSVRWYYMCEGDRPVRFKPAELLVDALGPGDSPHELWQRQRPTGTRHYNWYARRPRRTSTNRPGEYVHADDVDSDASDANDASDCSDQEDEVEVNDCSSGEFSEDGQLSCPTPLHVQVSNLVVPCGFVGRGLSHVMAVAALCRALYNPALMCEQHTHTRTQSEGFGGSSGCPGGPGI